MTITLDMLDVRPPVLLAPMAGITDLPFRTLVQRFGAGLVVSEMVASQELVQGKWAVREKAELGGNVANTAVQIAGRDAYWMAEAARMAEANGAQVIDINMGCPAKKVVGGYSGSALLRTPDHALSLIEAVVGAVSVPVTLKTRLGWDRDTMNAPDVARRAQSAGVRMITIHGRTRCDFYKGQADWGAIRAVREEVDVPLVANGDICSGADAKAALEASKADGVMIGRGAQGKPWILAEVAANLANAPRPTRPEGADFVAMVQEHYEAILSFYGTDLGLRVARKHLGWYMDTAGTTKSARRAMLTADSPQAVLERLPQALLEAVVPSETEVAA